DNEGTHITKSHRAEATCCDSRKSGDQADGPTDLTDNVFGQSEIVIKRIGHWPHDVVGYAIQADRGQHDQGEPAVSAEESDERTNNRVDETARSPERRLLFFLLTHRGPRRFHCDPGSGHSYRHQHAVDAVRYPPADA